MNKLIITRIFKDYSISEVLQSFATALLFFTLISAIILIPTIQIIYIYVPYLEYFLVFIYIAMSLNSVYFNKIFIETLQTYQYHNEINYDTFKVRSSTIMTGIIFLIELIVLIVLT